MSRDGTVTARPSQPTRPAPRWGKAPPTGMKPGGGADPVLWKSRQAGCTRRAQPPKQMSPMQRADIRNVAIIAHVDHGKTTLVDAMLRQSGAFPRQRRGSRPGHGLDRPRAGKGHHHPGQEHRHPLRRPDRSTSWTLRAMQTSGARWSAPSPWWTGSSCWWTPAKAPSLRPGSYCAKRSRLTFPCWWWSTRSTVPTPDRRRCSTPSTTCSSTSGRPSHRSTSRSSTATPDRAWPLSRPKRSPDAPGLKVLFELLVEHIPAPSYIEGHPFQALVANLDASTYVGRLAICRVHQGWVHKGDTVAWCRQGDDGPPQRARIAELYMTDALQRVDAGPEGAGPGDIIAIAGHPRDDDRRHPGRRFPTRGPCPGSRWTSPPSP